MHVQSREKLQNCLVRSILFPLLIFIFSQVENDILGNCHMRRISRILNLMFAKEKCLAQGDLKTNNKHAGTVYINGRCSP